MFKRPIYMIGGLLNDVVSMRSGLEYDLFISARNPYSNPVRNDKQTEFPPIDANVEMFLMMSTFYRCSEAEHTIVSVLITNPSLSPMLNGVGLKIDCMR